MIWLNQVIITTRLNRVGAANNHRSVIPITRDWTNKPLFSARSLCKSPALWADCCVPFLLLAGDDLIIGLPGRIRLVLRALGTFFG